MPEKLLQELKQRASTLGFDAVGICDVTLAPEISEHLDDFVARSWHGEMKWMKDTLERRKSPKAMWNDAVTAIMLATNYGPDNDPLLRTQLKSTGNISVYALNKDYHDLMKGRLKQLAGWFASRSGQDVKVFVDTAPLLEKPLAAKAGLGWQGKHTNLVSGDFGSWLFLGSILTTANLAHDQRQNDRCGSCDACLNICPTSAFAGPYKLEARRCISYLTIEYGGHIPVEFRQPMGNRIYGCDDCLAVCPWNKFAQKAKEEKLIARDDLVAPGLDFLSGLDDAAFRSFFSRSPVKRIGRNKFVRNVLIAIGNSQDVELAKHAKKLLADESELVRAMAVWAIRQLLDDGDFARIRDRYYAGETAASVRQEWDGSAL